ncbi:MAG: NADH-ubiquinone oxidoreductase-F iron-sulfur binding region domain-containing protein [Clostridia bacterium]
MNTENDESSIKILTNRCGKINALSIDEYIASGGFSALAKALDTQPADLVREVKASGLRGRGGAGFPTGLKMEAVFNADDFPKYIICNADEGEPGNFKDKYLIENDPYQLLEGIIIAAYAMGVNKGYIYIRGEYNKPIRIMKETIENAVEKGYLGKDILGKNYDFDIEIKSGAGSYVCGEEFALIESIEGKPGRPKNKPPYPSVSGVYNKPTLINNVETFSNLPYIIGNGAAVFSAIGTPTSKGTRLVCLSGNIVNRGVYEVVFGTTLREVIYELGGGIPENRKIKMVQLGGASGPCIPPDMLDLQIDYREFFEKELSMGSGAIIVVDERFEMLELLRHIMRFFKHESCGKCTPCREGNRQILRLLYKFTSGTATMEDLKLLETVGKVMYETSFCGLGQAAPTAIMTTIKYFKDEYLAMMGKPDLVSKMYSGVTN